MKKIYTTIFALSLTLTSGQVFAQSSSTLYKTTDDGLGDKVGDVTFTDTDDGLNIIFNLKGLPAGEHGFHVHENPDCSPIHANGSVTHASAAGGHYDPDKTGEHLGPDGNGHRGDLPKLIVDENGNASGSITFGKDKNLKAEEFKNRSLMVHQGGDNYSDEPVTLGGGGARIACGIIQ